MADETHRKRAIYFHGGDVEGARFLARSEVNGGKRAITRDARAFVEGDVEDCDRIVLLPSVRDWDMARIVNTYDRAGIPIENLIEPAAPQMPEATVTVPSSTYQPSQEAEELRRLSNKQLRDLAAGRGVDISSARDRAAMIAAIDAAAQKGATP